MSLWHSGHLGSQLAMSRAKARRAVMKDSRKWRSGLALDRVVVFLRSASGGKAPNSFGDNEGEARQSDGHMVMPATKCAPLEMVKAKFALEILVDPLGAVTFLHQADQLFPRRPHRQPCGVRDEPGNW